MNTDLQPIYGTWSEFIGICVNGTVFKVDLNLKLTQSGTFKNSLLKTIMMSKDEDERLQAVPFVDKNTIFMPRMVSPLRSIIKYDHPKVLIEALKKKFPVFVDNNKKTIISLVIENRSYR